MLKQRNKKKRLMEMECITFEEFAIDMRKIQ